MGRFRGGDGFRNSGSWVGLGIRKVEMGRFRGGDG